MISVHDGSPSKNRTRWRFFPQSVPILLAGEDDVIGNHAASAGKIDADMLFYIMNRAISRDVAESMIVESKFSESLSRLDDENLENKPLSFIREKIAKRELAVR